MKFKKNFGFILIIFLSLGFIAAQAHEQTLSQHFNACLNADNIHRINANGECLAIQTYLYKSHTLNKHPKLVIFLHGDGAKGGGPSDYLKSQATFFLDSNTASVVVIRPGYYDSHGNYSTGEGYAFACDGLPCDGYRKKTIATLVAGIKQLKNFYQPRCTVLVGHSGGAIMAGVILGKYPHLVNGAVLASTTNNVHEWANRHGRGTWPHSLSPHDWVSKIPQNTFVYILSGNNDRNTYPDLARAYYTSLIKLKIPAYFIAVPGGGHNSLVLNEAKELKNAIRNALKNC